jgi:phosphate transport system substrate-binding protein
MLPISGRFRNHDEQEAAMSTPSLVPRHPSAGCVFLVILFALLFNGCASTASTTGHTHCSTTTSLTGEGSTFDAPLFDQWFSVYPTTPCGLAVEYYAAGSGMGISTLLNQLVDFGATDAPLTAHQLANSSNGTILHFPVTLGAVAISYRLDGVSAPLKITGPVLATIYLGTIIWWDDPAIQHLNPDIALPHLAIQVLHRSDGSGTTAIFTQYLASVSPPVESQGGCFHDGSLAGRSGRTGQWRDCADP